jgi:hypothetical protein
VCGIHAQVMPAAELAIGVRVDGVTRQDVRAELWEWRRLVKTFGVRGTVHVYPAADFWLWMAALRANPHPCEERRMAQMGLDPQQKDAVVEAIWEALDGRCLSRAELGVEVARHAGDWAADEVSPAFGTRWPRWQMAMGAVPGQLCFGPNQGNKVTFARADQWIGEHHEVDGEEALREAFRRYLSAYGPATAREFARWFGMEPSVALGLTRELAGELEEVDVDGRHAWMLANDAAVECESGHEVVRLLPHFDCYVVGSHPRERLAPAAWKERVFPGGSGGNVPVVMIDGTVGGIWRHKRTGRRLAIQVELFARLDAGRRKQLEAAAARIAEIAEAELNLSLGPVDDRPHL